jgi:hypothetical protein
VGALSIAACAVWGYLLYDVAVKLKGTPPELLTVIVILFLWTKACFFFCFGIWCFCNAVLKWNGDSHRMLLLKMLGEKDIEQ